MWSSCCLTDLREAMEDESKRMRTGTMMVPWSSVSFEEEKVLSVLIISGTEENSSMETLSLSRAKSLSSVASEEGENV